MFFYPTTGGGFSYGHLASERVCYLYKIVTKMSCFVSEVCSSRNIPTGTDGLDRRRRRLGIDRTQKEIKPISRNIILPSSVPADTDGWRAFSGKKIEAKRTNVTVWRPLSLGKKDVFSLIFHPTDGSTRSGWMDGLAGYGVWMEHKKHPSIPL